MESYLGEIRIFAGNYAPQGWALCDGRLMSIAENEALFALLGTTYGGDGQTTFGLPDLRGRIPIHPSATHVRGSKGGTETVTLTSAQLPMHTHAAQASNSTTGNVTSPTNARWAGGQAYSDGVNQTPVAMNSQAVSTVGGNQAHDNMMPSLTVSFIISLYGVFPPQP